MPIRSEDADFSHSERRVISARAFVELPAAAVGVLPPVQEIIDDEVQKDGRSTALPRRRFRRIRDDVRPAIRCVVHPDDWACSAAVARRRHSDHHTAFVDTVPIKSNGSGLEPIVRRSTRQELGDYEVFLRESCAHVTFKDHPDLRQLHDPDVDRSDKVTSPPGSEMRGDVGSGAGLAVAAELDPCLAEGPTGETTPVHEFLPTRSVYFPPSSFPGTNVKMSTPETENPLLGSTSGVLVNEFWNT